MLHASAPISQIGSELERAREKRDDRHDESTI